VRERWKTAEILILRHQLAVLQRRQPRRPKLNRADRALVATMLGLIPKARRRALAPRHRPPPLGHQVHARQDWAGRRPGGTVFALITPFLDAG